MGTNLALATSLYFPLQPFLLCHCKVSLWNEGRNVKLDRGGLISAVGKWISVTVLLHLANLSLLSWSIRTQSQASFTLICGKNNDNLRKWIHY